MSDSSGGEYRTVDDADGVMLINVVDDDGDDDDLVIVDVDDGGTVNDATFLVNTIGFPASDALRTYA